MHKKYPVVIHAVLLLFCLLFLFGMFVERSNTLVQICIQVNIVT